MPTRRSHLIFTLFVLFAINTMNFYDRQVLPAVQEKIRKEWGLSDSELGWLGTAFILLYAIVGVPLGRLADVGQRKWILAAGAGLWSLMTLGSGLAGSFWSLLAMRLGVGIGEASCAPTASSLIGDLVPAERRARAMAVFMLGLPIGIALSFRFSGLLAQRYDWQTAFFVAGVPGLVLAFLALLIADPKSQAARGAEAVSGAPQSSPWSRLYSALRVPRSALVQILRPRTMWWLIASGALHNFNMYALASFLVSFLIRYHGVELRVAGNISSIVYGFGAIGIFAGGWLGDYAHRRSARGRLNVAWLCLAAAIPGLLLALAASPGAWLLCALALLPACTLMYGYYGTVYATIQDLYEPQLRGLAMAIYFCGMYLLGALYGPVATGWLSDHFARSAAGGEPLTDLHKAIGLHDAMYVVPILDVALVLVLFAASRTVKRDLERTRE